MGIFAERIQDDRSQVAVERAQYFFLAIENQDISPGWFSKNVHIICNANLSQKEKFAVLADPLRRRPWFLTSRAAVNYFTTVAKDELLDKILAAKLYENFAGLKTALGPDLKKTLDPRSKEIWAIQVVLDVVRVVAPDDLGDLARLILEKFPNIAGKAKDGKTYGFRRKLEVLAGQQGTTVTTCPRFQLQTKTAEQAQIDQKKDKKAEELRKLSSRPKTKANRRLLNSFFKTIAV